ncbi:uncharacterized protein B0T15DRAFT_533930 [Chaetomium strumarium]|uniref:DUF676 domain-containing protein n=1 Tax=Chaetomium strumarium TaxID=1170767 RepID=A0AAJ0M256_9PEZI|nr:hypothetical protein B0T15DRAFT_533930 [Chaetomium strumarium]
MPCSTATKRPNPSRSQPNVLNPDCHHHQPHHPQSDMPNLAVTDYGNHNQGLFTLPFPSANWEKTYGRPTLDVVAVHGLNGDCFTSWTGQSPSEPPTVWLNELLLQKLPRTRAMTFGYDASVIGNTSVAGVRGNARKLLLLLRNKREDDGSLHRPIVFVGHSLGGIIIKQALTLARNEWKVYGDILTSTKGIVFFGTPHRGSDVTQWGEVIANIKAASFGTRARTPFFKFLRPNAKDLLDLSEDFRPIAQNYALVSFIEENTFGRLGRVVVERYSAVMELPHEEQVYIGGDHSSMCKFTRDDERFDVVWRAIRQASLGPDTGGTFEIRGTYMPQKQPIVGAVSAQGEGVGASNRMLPWRPAWYITETVEGIPVSASR